jgi:hypothetical protein
LKCIPDVYLIKLVERMPSVCKAVIKEKGDYFKECLHKIYFDSFNTFFGYNVIPYVLFYSFVVFAVFYSTM